MRTRTAARRHRRGGSTRRRTRALALGLALSGCAGARPSPHPAPSLPPLRSGVDVHAHFLMRTALPFYAGEPGQGRLAAHPTETWANQLDAPTLRRAGIHLVVATLWPPLATRPRRTALDEALHQLQALHAFTRRQRDFQVARSAAELRALAARGHIALLPALEGVEGIRRVEDVDVLYAAGARVLTLTHFVDNAVADAADGQFGPVAALVLDGPRGGLTPLGAAVVRRMVALGMVVDVAHCSARTVEDVLALTAPAGVPILASHEGAAWATTRTLPDALARRIAQGGGLIGVGLYRHDVLQPVPEAERWEGHQAGTCDDVAAHWTHYAGVAGHAAVVLGSDLSAPIQRPLPGGLCPEGIRNAGDLPRLFGALEARGVPRTALDSMGERFLDFLARVEARADPAARAAALRTPVPRARLLDVPL